jgi:hypothetical protein
MISGESDEKLLQPSACTGSESLRSPGMLNLKQPSSFLFSRVCPIHPPPRPQFFKRSPTLLRCFCRKLKPLHHPPTDLFHLTSAALALNINVDAALVARWSQASRSGLALSHPLRCW